jgi:hypothetical protein
VVAEGIVSINLLQYAAISNDSDTTVTGLGRRNITRNELRSLVGITTSSGITISGNAYCSLVVDFGGAFYIKDGYLVDNNGGCVLDCYIQNASIGDWRVVSVERRSTESYINFNQVAPDSSQLIEKVKFIYRNLTSSGSAIRDLCLLTVDYPIDYNYTQFSIAASSYGNSPIAITNNSVQGTAKNIRVTPAFTGDYLLDRVFILTSGGKLDMDRYHIDRGLNLPEQAPWSAGAFENTSVSGRYLTLTGTALSGSWWSPAIYLPDPNFITMDVYVEDTNASSDIETDWLSINQVMQVRASNETPLPNFLINSRTPRFITSSSYQTTLSLPARRPIGPTTQTNYSPDNPFWYRVDTRYSNGPFYFRPYMKGRSERIYMKGDGTILASSVPDRWEFARSAYWMDVPFKIFGAINNYWNASTYVPLFGDFVYGDPATGEPSDIHHVLTYATLTSDAYWCKGGAPPTYSVGGRNMLVNSMANLMPYGLHAYPLPNLGTNAMDGKLPIYYDYIGATTIPKPNHPNNWIVLCAVMFPPETTLDKYMCLYLLNVRNFWVSEAKLIGTYGINIQPCDEGFAICPCINADEHEGGFWLHVGYATNIIEKYTGDGYLLASYEVLRGYNSLREAGSAGGLWAIRNDGVFYYQEDTTNNLLTVIFKVEDDRFEYLQGGDTDNAGNLWIVDRDTSIVYRINVSSRQIDYVNHIPYAVGVWPHPTDGSAFVYLGFHPESFSTAIKRVWANDPYGYEELVTTVPSMPLSDISGVQFTGKLSNTYISPGVNDPVWGTDDAITLDWENYVNGSLTMPAGDYKQFKITLRRSTSSIASPKIQRIRIPTPLIFNQVAYGESAPVYINPHLRYDKKTGHFTTKLLTWWPHGE